MEVIATCSVCLAPLAPSGSCDLECGHAFHQGCIIQWFRRGHADCPVCRHVPADCRGDHQGENITVQLVGILTETGLHTMVERVMAFSATSAAIRRDAAAYGVQRDKLAYARSLLCHLDRHAVGAAPSRSQKRVRRWISSLETKLSRSGGQLLRHAVASSPEFQVALDQASISVPEMVRGRSVVF